jgi:hypothetical protein
VIVETRYNVNIRFNSARERNKFIKKYKAEKAGEPLTPEGLLFVETVQVLPLSYRGSREVHFSVGVPIGEMETVILPGDWTVAFDFIPDHPGEGSHFRRLTHPITDPTWVRLWDAAEVLYRESGDFHRYFEGIYIDHENRVIELSLGS